MTVPGFTPTVRVLVVDDSPSFCKIAHHLIDDTGGFVCIGEASCGEDAVEETLRLQPDLVLMDVRMPGIGGIEAASRIASQAPFPVIVLITAGDLPEGVPGVAAEVLAKHHLNHASLRRVWTDHSRTPSG